VEGYLEGRPNLRGVLLVVDARRGIEDEERQLTQYLHARGCPILVVATKLDKLARARRERALDDIAAAAGETPVVGLSAVTGEGRDALWRRLLAPPFSLLDVP
jgi:GTP-binding protein